MLDGRIESLPKDASQRVQVLQCSLLSATRARYLCHHRRYHRDLAVEHPSAAAPVNMLLPAAALVAKAATLVATRGPDQREKPDTARWPPWPG